jgi:CspA family cold shock protein
VETRVINPIELDGDTVFVPEVEEEIEHEIVERRPARGRVRWYERSLGYGFLHEDGNNKEIFVHQKSLQMPGVKNLRKGQRVAFELCKTNKDKDIAINVIPIMERPEALEKYKAKHSETLDSKD